MRFKVTVAYNGSAYFGWQTQHRGDSVEEAIEAVLNGMHGKEIDVVASGRTDAKVHATGQVFHFDSDLDISEESMKTALNSQLPKDIRVCQVEKVAANFHARFDAISKRYDYYVSKEKDNPFIEEFMMRYYGELDLEAMRECATIFLGEHDFTSFTSAKIDPRKNRVRKISRLDILEEGNTIHFILEGNSFLRYMVRMLVQTIIEAGRHKIAFEEVKEMLDGKDKHLCRYKAVPQGLYLVEVKYK